MQTLPCFQYWKQKKVYTFFIEYCLRVSTTYYYSKYLRFVNHISAIYHANIKETSILRTNGKKSDRPPETHAASCTVPQTQSADRSALNRVCGPQAANRLESFFRGITSSEKYLTQSERRTHESPCGEVHGRGAEHSAALIRWKSADFHYVT